MVSEYIMSVRLPTKINLQTYLDKVKKNDNNLNNSNFEQTFVLVFGSLRSCAHLMLML